MGLKHGRFVEKNPFNHNLDHICFYEDGLLNDTFTEFHSTRGNQVKEKGLYKAGMRMGIWKQWDDYGHLTAQGVYGKLPRIRPDSINVPPGNSEPRSFSHKVREYFKIGYWEYFDVNEILIKVELYDEEGHLKAVLQMQSTLNSYRRSQNRLRSE
jgi:hypothetical protein